MSYEASAYHNPQNRPHVPQQPPPPAPKPPKQKRFGFLAATLFVGGGLIVGSMIGSATAGAGNPKTVEAPQATATVYTTGPAKKAAAPASKAPAPAAFADGQHIIGDDVKPGRYKTVLPAEKVPGVIKLCTVRIEDENGEPLGMPEVTNKGNTIVNVPNAKGAIMTVSGCGDFRKV